MRAGCLLGITSILSITKESFQLFSCAVTYILQNPHSVDLCG